MRATFAPNSQQRCCWLLSSHECVCVVVRRRPPPPACLRRRHPRRLSFFGRIQSSWTRRASRCAGAEKAPAACAAHITVSCGYKGPVSSLKTNPNSFALANNSTGSAWGAAAPKTNDDDTNTQHLAAGSFVMRARLWFSSPLRALSRIFRHKLSCPGTMQHKKN